MYIRGMYIKAKNWKQLKHSSTIEWKNNYGLLNNEGASQVAPVVKKPLANAGDTGDLGTIPGSGESSWDWEHGNPLNYWHLENLMNRGAWQATVHSITKSQTQLKWLRMHTFNNRNKWTTIWQGLTNITLSKRSHTQEATYCMILLTQSSKRGGKKNYSM